MTLDNNTTNTYLPADEVLTELTLDSIFALIERARRQHQSAEKSTAQIFALLDRLGIKADTIPTQAETADNLEQAILCFLQYGEYGLSKLKKEIKAQVL